MKHNDLTVDWDITSFMHLSLPPTPHKPPLLSPPPTVVIEDDRIDDVLKGMTDKSSPGV